MFRTKYIIPILGLVLAMGISACQKKSNTLVDPAKVVVTLSSPKDGALIKSGDTLLVTGTITYPTEMHGYEIKIVDTAKNMVVHDYAAHIHNDNYSIYDTWQATTTDTTVYQLNIIATIDHNGNISTSTSYFKYIP